ncbi:hypothetical protein A3F64_00455 [Candidatus Saccharibacteria bacterium RIFCSPHIGHO2_12_FULL_42_8]|nr:MAG: hypothetical protein A3F64_00455 [Candidatus Saccharibacteria bacterium RIFCSPHIGHO2_12_FULL_42_8]
MSKELVVIGDLHGYYEPFEKAVDYYGDTPDGYLVNGDLIGAGPSTARVLDIAQDVDADINIGNWELYLLAGMLHEDEETRQRIQQTARVFSDEKGILSAIASSYGIATKATTHAEKIERLKEAMLEKSHLQMLARAAMYFEEKDFIVIHAGLTDAGWLLQKQELFYAREDLLENTGKEDEEEYNEPPQITSLSLARQQEAFQGSRKTVITGHTHMPQGDRVTANGARVRLGSRLELHESLFAWQSWNGELREFSQD